jgi:hypothetical protein
VAVSAVNGAIDAARTTGQNVEQTAAAAAKGAVDAAYDVSDAAGVAVRNAVTGTINGVRVSVDTAYGQNPEDSNRS